MKRMSNNSRRHLQILYIIYMICLEIWHNEDTSSILLAENQGTSYT